MYLGCGRVWTGVDGYIWCIWVYMGVDECARCNYTKVQKKTRENNTKMMCMVGF